MLRFETREGPVEIPVETALVAGWTGRDRDAVEHHIEELAELGVARPSAIPLYYRVSAALVTQRTGIDVVGGDTSGEAEPVIVDDGQRLWLTVGSDHTDRALEAHSVALSKQICAKPVARQAWEFDTLTDRLDTLELYSWVHENGDWVPYQQGTLAAIRRLEKLISGAPGAKGQRLGAGAVLFCGTLPVLGGGVRPAARMKLELRDPAGNDTIVLDYTTRSLPLVS